MLHKEYEKVFVGVDVPTIQPQPVESTQGTSRTPRALRTPTHVVVVDDVVQKRRESNDDRERDEIAEATLLSLTMHKAAIVAEAQENVAKVQEKLIEEDIEKMVYGKDEESYAKTVDDDDEEEKKYDKKDGDNDANDNDDYTDYTLVKTQEWTDTVSPTPDTTSQDHSKPTFSKTKVLPGSIAGMGIRRGINKKHMKTTYVTNKYFQEKIREIPNLLKNLVPKLTVAKTNELIKEVVPRRANAAIMRDKEIAPNDISDLISQEFATYAPKIIEELFKSHMQNTVLNMYPITTRDPYSTIDKPTTGLVYLNNKEEKRVMYLVEIAKFCDATLKIVLKEVKLKIFETEFWKKAPLLGELDINILKAFEREITKRLRHREQMRMWESFVNGRPILPAMKRE
uniref:Uncharacterized protein n=1 Tax=Tanacetum cinerariifolium TaxID=118510 RepID=A0A6L2KHK3_TANCI|nr:hypothetical protein [Tanacetum cinerariifolium]